MTTVLRLRASIEWEGSRERSNGTSRAGTFDSAASVVNEDVEGMIDIAALTRSNIMWKSSVCQAVLLK